MAPAARDESESSEELSPGKGCAHYLLELKEGNRKFWVNGHGVVKFLTLVSWAGIPWWERESGWAAGVPEESPRSTEGLKGMFPYRAY